jgi:hypothetical protein
MDTGVCVSCGAEDVELNDNGECENCAGAKGEGEEEMGEAE